MTRMPMPSDLGFGERADFAVFGGEIALADVHHARVGVGGAAAQRRFDRQLAQSCIMSGIRLGRRDAREILDKPRGKRKKEKRPTRRLPNRAC